MAFPKRGKGDRAAVDEDAPWHYAPVTIYVVPAVPNNSRIVFLCKLGLLTVIKASPTMRPPREVVKRRCGMNDNPVGCQSRTVTEP